MNASRVRGAEALAAALQRGRSDKCSVQEATKHCFRSFGQAKAIASELLKREDAMIVVLSYRGSERCKMSGFWTTQVSLEAERKSFSASAEEN